MTLRDSLPASPHSVWGRHHRRYRWNAKDRIPATWEVNWVIWFGLLSAFRISPSKGSFFQKLTCLLIQEKWVYFSTKIWKFLRISKKRLLLLLSTSPSTTLHNLSFTVIDGGAASWWRGEAGGVSHDVIRRGIPWRQESGATSPRFMSAHTRQIKHPGSYCSYTRE